MKILQYNNPQKYVNLMRECIVCSADYLKLSCEKARCIELPRLNIIVKENIDPKLFLKICFEYKFHKRTITKWIARLYIFLIYIHLFFRAPIFLHRKSTFMMPLGYVAVMGGNNRIRLIDAMNTFALLMPTDTANLFFIQNVMYAYKPDNCFPMNLMPKIFSISDRVYFEQQVEGVAINRLHLSENQQKFLNDKMNHYFACQNNAAYNVKLKLFFSSRIDILSRYEGQNDTQFCQMYINLCNDVEKYIEELDIRTNVRVSPAHGDLNLGNILYCSNNIYIIDWEYCFDRHVDYDRIIYSFNLRHLGMEDYTKFVENTTLNDIDILIFLIEDILFRCINYKKDFIDSKQHIDCIENLIRFKIAS